jgi:hypothetical protein
MVSVATHISHNLPLGNGQLRQILNSAEIVVGMIVSEIAGLKWSIPDWLPARYLTWNRIWNKEHRGETVVQSGSVTG